MKSLYSAVASLCLTTLSLVPLKRVCSGMAWLTWSLGRTLLDFVEAAAIVQVRHEDGLGEVLQMERAEN